MRHLWDARPQLIYFALVTSSALAIGILFWLSLAQRSTLQSEIHNTAVAAYEADRALCLRKSTTRDELRRSLDYLRIHPNGTPDIPRALIVQGIRTDRTTIRALSDVQCPPRRP